MSDMAGSMRRAANEFGQIPQAAQYMRLAAEQIDSVSDAFRRRDLNQLVSDVQGFARRQPPRSSARPCWPGLRSSAS